MTEKKYCGTYPVRKLSAKEQVIHMPPDVTGDFGIFICEDGNILLVHVGRK